MMKTLLKLLTGLMMMGVLVLLLMESRTDAANSLQSGEVTATPQAEAQQTSDGPIVSEPVSPSMSQEVKSLPSNEGPYTDTPREINPLQNNQQDDNQMTPTPQVQVPTVSEPVAPTTSQPVKNLPTAEPYDGSEPYEINPRQHPEGFGTVTPVPNREQEATVSEPVAPGTSPAVNTQSVPTAEPYEGPDEVNPRQNGQNRQSQGKHDYGPCDGH
jgi:hypothetical protein